MNLVIINLIVFLFEKTPLLSLLNGKKRQIGKAVTIAGPVLALAKVLVPATSGAGAILSQIDAGYVTLSGLVVKQLGDTHAEIKDAR